MEAIARIMINLTAKEIFDRFLYGIRKERTSQIRIDDFNALIQDSTIVWLNSILPEGEIVQERIDQIECLRVATDDVTVYNGNILQTITPVSNPIYRSLSFHMPKYYGVAGHQLENYPNYLRLLNVGFTMTYDGNDDDGPHDSNGWEWARIMRSDKKRISEQQYYRKAKEGRLYYEIVNNLIRVITSESAVANLMNLEYYRYPVKYFLDETNLNDHTTETALPYTAGYGSIPLEFDYDHVLTIIEIAVAKHLSR
jgi:hypothetical protein